MFQFFNNSRTICESYSYMRLDTSLFTDDEGNSSDEQGGLVEQEIRYRV